jgi:hypothetical protein
MAGQIMSTRFKLGHRVRIDISTPRRGHSGDSDTEVANQDVHKYRMQATDNEVLSVEQRAKSSAIDSAYKQAALAYHPNKFNELDDLEKAILTRRMQELNEARERLRSRKKS